MDVERNDDFVAKVRSAPRPRPPAPGGKGSPTALLVIGLVGTGTLGLCAALLGGSVLVYVAAAIPLATVLLVLLSRRLAAR